MRPVLSIRPKPAPEADSNTGSNGIKQETLLLHTGCEIYRVEKNGLQNIAKQDPGRAGQNR